MMKTKNMITKIVTFALAALMLLSLVSCDKSSSVKKAFEKAEYKVETVDTNNAIAKPLLSAVLSEDQMKEAEKYEVILCSKGLAVAVILKFPGSGDIKDLLTVEKDGKKDSSAYDDAKKDGTVNGNCMIFTISNDAKDIFKKA